MNRAINGGGSGVKILGSNIYSKVLHSPLERKLFHKNVI